MRGNAHNPRDPSRRLPAVLNMVRFGIWRLRRLRVLVMSTVAEATIAPDARIGSGLIVRSRGLLRVGQRVAIGRDVQIESDLIVNSDVLISSRVAFVGNDHPFDGELTVYSGMRAEPELIVLEGDNLIGFGSILVAPVNVGVGAIIGAGSVVTDDVAPNSIVAGVPARHLRYRKIRPDKDSP